MRILQSIFCVDSSGVSRCLLLVCQAVPHFTMLPACTKREQTGVPQRCRVHSFRRQYQCLTGATVGADTDGTTAATAEAVTGATTEAVASYRFLFYRGGQILLVYLTIYMTATALTARDT